MWTAKSIGFVLLFWSCCNPAKGGPVAVTRDQSDIKLGNCIWVVDRNCPDADVKFYLFSKQNPNDRQPIAIGATWDKSNLSASHFDPDLPTKIIMHGFNSDMYLTPLIDMKDEYLQRSEYNLFYVDYSELARGPCYISAVHNIRHVGKCVGQLLDRILETGSRDIHLVGFSLGAQVTNFVAQAVRPFQIPRITGLDPAMPLFVGVPNADKLDSSDAKFVDVFHTNAFLQGKIEKCGHVDFYFNGGILQPGCQTWKDNPAGCSHNRAPMYFMESIRSYKGFWGWSCNSYISYLLGFCPKTTSNLVVAGEDCRTSTRGMYFVKTRHEAPFAEGRGNSNNRFRLYPNDFMIPSKRRDPLFEEIDQWGKLDGAFNNIQQFPTAIPQDPQDDWQYFGAMGPGQIDPEYVNDQSNYYNPSPSENEDDTASPEGPYGIQVLDVLHKKQGGQKRPHRVKTKSKNSTEQPHLIQSLWEDFNTAESRPGVSYFPLRRQALNGRYGDNFFALPVLIQEIAESVPESNKN